MSVTEAITSAFDDDDDEENPVIVSTRSLSLRSNAQLSETEIKNHAPSGSRTRKKSFDTSSILFELPDLETRYFHKEIWQDSNGRVFRGKNPMKTTQNHYDENKAVEESIIIAGNQSINDGKTNICIESEKVSDPTEELRRLRQKKKQRNRIKKILFLEIKIKRISAIDTTSESFRCRFHYYLTWLASKDEYNAYLEDSDNYSPDWVPKVEWVNAAELHGVYQGSNFTIKSQKNVGFNSEWRISPKYLGFDAKNGIWNRVRYEADITFAEELELEAFPFDCQDLSLYMKVEKDNIEFCDIVPFPREGDFCLLDPQFSVLSEWYLENLVTEFGYTDPLKSKSLRCYSLVSVHIKSSRRWEAHLGMIIVTFCMFSLGLGTFAQTVEPEGLGERLGFCVTFLLADVATLQLMFVHLPNIPYWTIMDFYVYTSFIFLFTITIWSCLAGANHGIFEDGVDGNAFWIFLAMYIIIHIAYVSFSVYYRRRERSKLTMCSSELENYFSGERSASDRRAISNGWDEERLSEGAEAHHHMNQDLTSFHFQGAKLEKVRTIAQMFSE